MNLNSKVALVTLASIIFAPVIAKPEEHQEHLHEEKIVPIFKMYTGKSENQITGTTSNPILRNIHYNA